MSLIHKTNPYHNSLHKLLLDYTVALTGITLFLPLFAVISLEILMNDGFPVFFIQKRVGKNGKVFNLIKFRTMRQNAEKEKRRILHLNEADGPVFKIKNDPRYTKIGKSLAKTGLDELPQIFNVLKGEMSIVGPRPLPPNEAKRLIKTFKIREKILPGITSSWVISGSHQLSFKTWMDLDKKYVKNAGFLVDLSILTKTAIIMFRQTINQLLKILFKDIKES